MRIVFAGTPDPAVPSLTAIAHSGHYLVGVVTRTDAPLGRKRVLTPSPVATAAADLGVPIVKADRLGDDATASVAALEPDLGVIVAYGGLVREPLLSVPRHGWINLHFSLLPRWRGAAPVQAAIAAGDPVTGASTFQIELALDSGPVYGVLTETIRPTDTAGELLDRLAISGAELLEATLDGVAAGALTAIAQPTDGVSYAAKISVDDARVRWELPAAVLERRIRSVTPHPGAWTVVDDVRIKLGPVEIGAADAAPPALAPGEVHADRRHVWVGTGSEPVRLGQVQPPGKKPMIAADWARGARLAPGVCAS